jgi:hypothetical protein
MEDEGDPDLLGMSRSKREGGDNLEEAADAITNCTQSGIPNEETIKNTPTYIK